MKEPDAEFTGRRLTSKIRTDRLDLPEKAMYGPLSGNEGCLSECFYWERFLEYLNDEANDWSMNAEDRFEIRPQGFPAGFSSPAGIY